MTKISDGILTQLTHWILGPFSHFSTSPSGGIKGEIGEDEIQSHTQKITDRLALDSNIDSEFSFHVSITSSSRPYAAATLIGHYCTIAIGKGIWDPKKGFINKDNDDEWAALLGHEMAHCTGDHSVVKHETIINKGKKAYLQMARELEFEADEIGLIYMMNAGYNPNAAIEIRERVANNFEPQGWDESKSDHPSEHRRVAALRKILEELTSP